VFKHLIDAVELAFQNFLGQRELQRRYNHIRQHLDVRGARIQLSSIGNAGFQELLERLDDLNIIVGADALLPADGAQALPRFGLTLVIPGRPPLIWLNLLKHSYSMALVDTVAHEAIHATVKLLGRHPQTPQPTNELAYHAEEIVALRGANWILNQIEVSANRQITQNLATIDHHAEILIRLGRSPAFLRQKAADGITAARFLMEPHLIEVVAPNLAELNAPR